jgi:DNA-binding MarR family transcriptional regulator
VTAAIHDSTPDSTAGKAPEGAPDGATPATTLDADTLRRVEAAMVTIVRGVMHGSHQFASGIDRAGYVTLVALERAGMVRQTDLACSMNLDLSTVSRQVKTLEELGLVRRTDDPDDRRASVLAVTAAGRREITRQRQARWAPVAERVAGIAALDRERFIDFLEQLAEISSPTPSKTGKAPR